MKRAKIIGLIVIILIGICFIYKLSMLNKYKTSEISIDFSKIFNEKLNIEPTHDYDFKTLEYGNLSFKNVFDGYSINESNPSLNVKYANEEVESYYGVSIEKQYIKKLTLDSLKLYSDNANDSKSEDIDFKSFLDSENIKDDIDFINYIKNNDLKNNVFTNINKMKINHLINNFIQVSFLEFDNIVLLDGSIKGYIFNTNNGIKEIHILNDDLQYVITLFGEEITSNNFIKELLSTVKFSQNSFLINFKDRM